MQHPIDQYGLDKLDPKRLRARREAARLHLVAACERPGSPDYVQNHWAVVVSICDGLLARMDGVAGRAKKA